MMYREPDPHADAIAGFEPTQITFGDEFADSAPQAGALRADDGPDFAALTATLRPWGGFIEGETLARLLQERGLGDFSLLAKAIVSRQLISVQHAGRQWLPVFQFDTNLAVRPQVRRLVVELKDTFDATGLVQWFVERNEWLRDRRPIDLVDSEFGEVWNAACADRFVATGFDALQ
jgi:hypothetical protein